MSDEIEEIALLIYTAIFQDEPFIEVDGIEYQIEKTSKSKVRLVKYDDFTFIEQNPFKSSRWGKEAQEGHQIMWVMKGRKYLARVRDGKFLDLRKSS
ncbi:MAG: hypothetical protein ACFFFO_06345 [Candidatus Thorarchaeota archaeon]